MKEKNNEMQEMSITEIDNMIIEMYERRIDILETMIAHYKNKLKALEG